MPLIARADDGVHCLFLQSVAQRLCLQPTRLEDIAPRQLSFVPQADIRIARVKKVNQAGYRLQWNVDAMQ